MDVEMSKTIEEMKKYYDILSDPSRKDPILIDELKKQKRE